MRAPFPPLVAGAEGLDRPPAAPDALRQRMAEVYGVDADQVLPVAGAAQAIDLVVARCAVDGTEARLAASPDPVDGGLIGAEEARRLAAAAAPGLLAVDESGIEFCDEASLAALTAEVGNLVVVRSLELAYGLAGAPCAALIAAPAVIARLTEIADPAALSTPVVRLAEGVLAPSRALATQARLRDCSRDRDAMTGALAAVSGLKVSAAGPWIFVNGLADKGAALAALGVDFDELPDGGLRLTVGSADANARALAAFGATSPSAPGRRAEVVRDTKETKIAVTVDLDNPGTVKVSTGLGFYDHMLDQVATHGGFSLTLACDGDLEIDGHHTIEDCALALGAALRQALGDKRGLARFGFALPMDEAEAKVLIDLGGRPFAVFEGDFETDRIGEYPTEMTAHVFRSLSESMAAAIHVEVRGENDHHKTEACYKAFGRALRQALRVEGSAVPSTKGVI